MTPGADLRGEQAPARRVGPRSVACGDYVYTLLGGPSDDPLPDSVVAVVPILASGTQGDRGLWLEVYVRPRLVLTRRTDLVGDPAPPTPRAPRLLGVYRAGWQPSPSAAWSRGEALEVLIGPLGHGVMVRAAIAAFLMRVTAAGEDVDPGSVSRDPARCVATIEARIRQVLPDDFDKLAAITRVIERWEGDDADVDAPEPN